MPHMSLALVMFKTWQEIMGGTMLASSSDTVTDISHDSVLICISPWPSIARLGERLLVAKGEAELFHIRWFIRINM